MHATIDTIAFRGRTTMQTTRLIPRWLGTIALVSGAWTATAFAQPCATDAECAPPLACRPGASTCSQSGSMDADGGMTVSDPVCVTEPAACTWVLVACQTDADCTQPSWTCMLLEGAQPTTHICFPRGIDCSVGAACPAGWSCVDFATVEEPDLAGMWTSTGSTKFCWPDVLSGVPHKTTPVDATQLGITGVAGGGSESPPRGTVDGGSAGGTGSDDNAPLPSPDKGSGCSMLGDGASLGLWLPVALVLLPRSRRCLRRRRQES
jgi:hypothetical protein